MTTDSSINNEEIPIEETVNSLSEFTNFLLKKSKNNGQEFVYRGEQNYPGNIGKLTPYIFREDKKRIVEKNLINGVINERPMDFENSNSTLDILITMQHYGIPTRLLDISYNPYKGLYFALENPLDRNNKQDGFFYLIDKKCFKEKTINSDSVSIVSSISRLNNEDKKTLSETYKFYLLCKALMYKFLIKSIKEDDDKKKQINQKCVGVLFEFENLLDKLNFSSEISKIEEDLKISLESFSNSELLSSCYQNEPSINEFGIPFRHHEDIENALNYIDGEYKKIFELINEKMSVYTQDSLKNKESQYFRNLKKSFNEFYIIQKLLHEVRNFNPGFRDELVMDDLVENYLILPRNTNQRIINQEGGFILRGLQLSDYSVLIGKENIIRIKIPQKNKGKILGELEKFHSISESFIYPELDHYNFRKFEQNEFIVNDHRVKINGNTVTIFSRKDKKKLTKKSDFLKGNLEKLMVGQPNQPNPKNNLELAKKIFNLLYDEAGRIN